MYPTFRIHSTKRSLTLLLLLCSTLAMSSLSSPQTSADDLKVGLIGLDTSHVTAFTSILNDPTHKKHVPGARVVAAVKAGSPDIESSASRIEGYTRELQEKWKVEIVPTVEILLTKVDAVLLTSLDGRPKLAQARPVLVSRKPMFIDKPVAGSLKDAIELFRLAQENQAPVFTSSSYRFYDSMRELKKTDVGDIRTVLSYGPGPTEPHHPDLFWYGIHPTEALYTLIGLGCETVTRTSTADTDVVTGVWNNGRVGVLLTRKNGPSPHEATVFGSKSVAIQRAGGDDYAPLVAEIVRFFQTRVPPVPAEETLEMFTFMEAADESRRQDGRPVKLKEVRNRASQR